MASFKLELSGDDCSTVRIALVNYEAALRRSKSKYQQSGKVEFAKLVDKDIAACAKVLMLIPA